ncbi:MAG: 2-aminoethylphosphonate aminotransferase [Burkholderiales bacterium]|nr:2-aminoethylphosphonate aminotransferase [Burkholderiales bacterium]MDQ3197070.1 2-aminoethylphosphonate aminotransferase [Pseudomonadota bacterium]
MILLNPGPVNLGQRVRNALTSPDLCHREPEFAVLQQDIRARLLRVYDLAPAQWAAVLLTGSGTAAVEAMISSLVPENGRLLILENGVYGERMSAMARVYHLDHVSLQHPWLAPLDVDRIEACIEAAVAENRRITHIAIVHHETTTGRLNRLDEIGALCKSRAVALLVDAVSSFGAEEIDFDALGITACAATANKCLHGAPGASFVVVKRAALPAAARRSLYLDLATHCREQDAASTPFTPAIPAFYALREALVEFDEQGGWQKRRECYAALLGRVREGLLALSIEPLLPQDEASVVLNAFTLPRGVDYTALHDGLKQRGFVIYAGQAALAKTLFRISTMGEIGESDVERLLDAVRQVAGMAGA